MVFTTVELHSFFKNQKGFLTFIRIERISVLGFNDPPCHTIKPPHFFSLQFVSNAVSEFPQAGVDSNHNVYQISHWHQPHFPPPPTFGFYIKRKKKILFSLQVTCNLHCLCMTTL